MWPAYLAYLSLLALLCHLIGQSVHRHGRLSDQLGCLYQIELGSLFAPAR